MSTDSMMHSLLLHTVAPDLLVRISEPKTGVLSVPPVPVSAGHRYAHVDRQETNTSPQELDERC